MTNRSVWSLVVVFCLWMGCSPGTKSDSTASIQQAVEKHLSARTDLDPAHLNVTVEKVSFEGDRATASVTIQARQDPQAKMQMVYNLRKSGDGWEVEPQAPAAGAHGGGMVPPATAPMPGAGEPPTELPPGHPAVGGASGAEPDTLPPGHPPIGGQPSLPKSSTQ